MENLFIERTDQSLEVDFKNNGDLNLEGISTPDHVNNFFTPVFDWISIFRASKPNTLNLIMYIDYLNTSSTRILVELLKKILILKEEGTNVNVLWKYDEDDEDMQELGEELSLVSGIKLEFESVAIVD